MLKIKRAYDKAEKKDGKQILIDRLWPRGVSKSEANVDTWLKELAPSTELRKWFAHDPQKWEEFRKKYKAELDSPEKVKLLEDIAGQARRGDVTLIYSARDTEHSDVKVLVEIIDKIIAGTRI